MIPLSASEPYRYTDPKTKQVLLLKYMVGPMGDEFMRITGEFQGLTDAALADDPAINQKYCAKMVDLFLVGIENPDGQSASFGSEKPTDFLRFGDVIKIGTIITELTAELTGIEVEDAKN